MAELLSAILKYLKTGGGAELPASPAQLERTMNDDWSRYGSPYDPGHRGKMRRPQQRREPEQRSICVCGDPNCSLSQDGKSGGSAPGSGSAREVVVTFDPFSTESTNPNMQSEFIRILRANREQLIFGSSDPDPARPPASYTAARKEVAKWLVTAPDQAFDDVVGNAAALEALRDAIEAPVKHAELYAAYAMKMPKGALLSGPPGCGKTMFARAAASEMKRHYGAEVEFLSISGSELQSPYVGVTEGYIKAIFTFAREYQAHHGHPLLVFMDEAEVLLPDRTGRVRRVAPWEESQVATFLAEMDGIRESGAFVLLASNRPEVIDQAVLRDGRCDFKIVVKRPTREAAETILRNAFAGVPAAGGDVEPLIFAAVEALFDPHKILARAGDLKLKIWGEAGELKSETSFTPTAHFLLEHIVSGAIAVSIPARAKRRAFARDKASGAVSGVSIADVLGAVNDLFEENRTLDHTFALEEWKREFLTEPSEPEKPAP